MAADRHRLVHVFAGIAVAEQRRFGRRAQRLARLLIVRKPGRDGGERDRKIGAVAGAHADGAVGAGLRADIRAGRVRIVVAEQIVEKVAAAGGATRKRSILRPAIVLRQRGQNRTALIVAIGIAHAAAAQPLEIAGDLVEIGPHLLDLVVDRTALRGLTGKQREKSGAVAAHPLGLRRDAVEFALLPGGGILVAPDLVVFCRVSAAAAVDGRQLRFQPRTHRIDGARSAVAAAPVGDLRPGAGIQRDAAKQHGAGHDPSREGGNQRVRHIRPIELFRAAWKTAAPEPGGFGDYRRAQPRPPLAASQGSVTSFPGRRCGSGGILPPRDGPSAGR